MRRPGALGLSWALASVAPLGAWALGLQHSPCAFTSEGEYRHCCCDRTTFCWGPTSVNFQVCCGAGINEVCPPESPIRQEQLPPKFVGRGGVTGTEAIYQFHNMNTTFQQVLDCDHHNVWRLFRLRLGEHNLVDLPSSAVADPSLQMMALQLVDNFNISQGNDVRLRNARAVAHSLQTFQAFQVYYSEETFVTHPTAMFCLFGYLSAAFVLALKTQERQLLRDAQYLLTIHGLQDFDVSSSTSWPIGYWDLALNLGKGRPARITTLAAFEASGHIPVPRVQPVFFPTGTEALLRIGRGRKDTWGRLEIRATAIVHHPSLDIEIPSFLLRYFPDHVRLTFAFLQMGSSYTGSSMQSHICQQWPNFCSAPHRAVTVEGPDGSGPAADLHLCSWYVHCARLEEWADLRLPLISYYGGFPVNSFAVRDGRVTVQQELAPLFQYLKRTPTAEPSAPALLLSDGPYTSEFVHSYTGVRLPVYRPLASYLPAHYSPSLEEILMLRSKSSTPSGASEWMYKMLNSFAGKGFQPKFTLQNGFLSFEQIASFKAIAYLPGPHSWILMQWREMYSMNMPLLIPRREDLMLHSHNWHRKLLHNLITVPAGNWKPLVRHWSLDHPFSPFPPKDGEGSTYVQANMYWSQWLEYFHWPHVQTFSGAPHLLELVHSLDFQAISHKMSEWNRAAVWAASEFWRDALPGLLQCDRPMT